MNYLTMFVMSLTVGSIVTLPNKAKIEPKTINTQVIEGHYLVEGPKYRGTAMIAKPAGTQLYLVYQYNGATVTKGVGFMSGGLFIFGWDTGVTSISFRDGRGRASWVSNPGNGIVGHETWSLIDDEE